MAPPQVPMLQPLSSGRLYDPRIWQETLLAKYHVPQMWLSRAGPDSRLKPVTGVAHAGLVPFHSREPLSLLPAGAPVLLPAELGCPASRPISVADDLRFQLCFPCRMAVEEGQPCAPHSPAEALAEVPASNGCLSCVTLVRCSPGKHEDWSSDPWPTSGVRWQVPVIVTEGSEDRVFRDFRWLWLISLDM